jgi:methylated-DNA-protein-cysteine methyltransferase-like protein
MVNPPFPPTPPTSLTSGHVAKLINRPRNSRQVGQALKFLQDETVPWQRVVNHKGIISPRDEPGAANRQRVRLLEEGILVEDAGIDADFDGGGGGGGRVDLALFGWFPVSVNIPGE